MRVSTVIFDAISLPELMIVNWIHRSKLTGDFFFFEIHLHIFSEKSFWWRHNGRDGVSNHQLHDCLLNRLFRCRSKKTLKLLCVTGLCAGNSPGTGKFPEQMASNAKDVSIWWRHHVQNSQFVETSMGLIFLICFRRSDAFPRCFSRSRNISQDFKKLALWTTFQLHNGHSTTNGMSWKFVSMFWD